MQFNFKFFKDGFFMVSGELIGETTSEEDRATFSVYKLEDGRFVCKQVVFIVSDEGVPTSWERSALVDKRREILDFFSSIDDPDSLFYKCVFCEAISVLLTHLKIDHLYLKKISFGTEDE